MTRRAPIARRVRFLVLRGGAIGDFIVTLPALAALRSRWPEAHIELIGYPHVANLAMEGGLVDKVDSLDRAKIARFFAQPAEFSADQIAFIRSFDLIFSWLHDGTGVVRENLLCAGARQVVYGSPLIPPDAHAVDHLLKPLEALAIYEQGVAPQLSLSEAARTWGRRWWAERGYAEPGIVIHPGSGSPRKNWPLDRFCVVADRLREATGQAPVFLVGDADEAQQIELSSRLPPNCLAAGLSLSDAARIVSVCSGYIGNDSGITHLAAALSCPVTALFGPTPVTQWGPRGERVEVITSKSGVIDDLSVETVWSRISARI